jgi:uncharacterized iron-regulated membrane protein
MLNFILFCCLVLLVVALCFWFRARNHGQWRRILYKTHLWLGIASGIVLFIVCLTGTVLVFKWEIITFLEHNKYFVSPPDMSPLKMEDLIAKVEQNMNGKVNLIQSYSRRNGAAYVMYIEMENNKNAKTKFRHEYMIDPYTGESLGNRVSPLWKFFDFIKEIHTSLLLPSPIGGIVVGSVTLIFVVIALSGLCLWLPTNFRNKKAWKNGFLIRFRKGKNQLPYDLHKTLGFFVLIPMLLMALTGLDLAFDWVGKGVRIIFNVQQHSYVNCLPPRDQFKSLPPNPDSKPLPFGFFIRKADELLAHCDYRAAVIREQENEPVLAVGMNGKKPEKILFDRYTGEILWHGQFNNLHVGEKIVSLFGTLHDGSVLGLPTQILYFIACLIATTLPVTGVIIWWRKLRHS